MTEERRSDYMNLSEKLSQLDLIPKIDKRLERIEASIHGNRKPGILTRLAVLETKVALPLWIAGVTAAALIGALVSKALGAW